MNFWNNLKKPFFVLAPMEDVTDVAFRAMFAKYSEPDVLWTEFTSADALAHEHGRARVDHRLRYDSGAERPIVAQIFGANPETIEIASRLCAERGFDGVDINMGCPVKKIESSGSCSGLIKTPELAADVIAAAKKGAGDMPVSVKTRIGYNKEEIDTWISHILRQDVPVLTVHLRTKKEMSDVPAHWECMERICALRDEIAPETLIIGNGDVVSMIDAQEKINTYGCDGIMIGRGAFGNPWFFRTDGYEPSIRERLEVLVEHTQLFEKEFLIPPADAPDDWYRDKNFAIMKKHFKAYVNGFDGASALRVELMEAENAAQIKAAVQKFLTDHNL